MIELGERSAYDPGQRSLVFIDGGRQVEVAIEIAESMALDSPVGQGIVVRERRQCPDRCGYESVEVRSIRPEYFTCLTCLDGRDVAGDSCGDCGSKRKGIMR